MERRRIGSIAAACVLAAIWALGAISTLGVASCTRVVPNTVSPTVQVTVPGPVKHIGRWLLVDTKAEDVIVFEGAQEIARFKNAAFGVAGAGVKHRRGDGVTPRGVFRMGAPRASNRFGTFVPIEFPNAWYAKQALQSGVLAASDYRRINKALSFRRTPPQDTPLGGEIGLHGVGKGSLKIHRLLNWTDGCIALENEQMRELSKLIYPGMLIEIR